MESFFMERYGTAAPLLMVTTNGDENLETQKNRVSRGNFMSLLLKAVLWSLFSSVFQRFVFGPR
jgi:hypothetical protein